jgi:hypothetical protein
MIGGASIQTMIVTEMMRFVPQHIHGYQPINREQWAFFISPSYRIAELSVLILFEQQATRTVH